MVLLLYSRTLHTLQNLWGDVGGYLGLLLGWLVQNGFIHKHFFAGYSSIKFLQIIRTTLFNFLKDSVPSHLDLEWITRPRYCSGGYILEYSQCPASSLWCSDQIRYLLKFKFHSFQTDKMCLTNRHSFRNCSLFATHMGCYQRSAPLFGVKS